MKKLLAVVASALCAGGLFGAVDTATWTGAGGNNLWTNNLNWVLTSTGQAPAQAPYSTAYDVVIVDAAVVNDLPNSTVAGWGDLNLNSMTLRGTASFSQPYRTNYSTFNTLTLEDDAVFSTAAARLTLTKLVLKGGEFNWWKRDSPEMTWLPAFELTGGTLKMNSNKGNEKLIIAEDVELNGSTVDVRQGLKSTAAAAVLLQNGRIVSRVADATGGLNFGANYAGGYVDFRPYSKAVVSLPNATTPAENAYAVFFSGETPVIRHNGAAITETEFADLFKVEASDESGAGLQFSLKVTEPPSGIIVDITPYAGTYDAKTHNALVRYGVAAPQDCNATWVFASEEEGEYTAGVPQVSAAGEHVFWYRCTVDAPGYETDVAKGSFTVVITPLDALAGFYVPAIANHACTGAAIEPTPAIKTRGQTATLAAGTDYEIVWDNNTEVGVAHGTVTGQGNYSGVFDIYFNIIPATPPTYPENIIYVNPSAAAGGLGTSPEDAMTSLEVAAATAKSGDTIRLADGVYPVRTPVTVSSKAVTIESASGNRDACILDGGGVSQVLNLTGASSSSRAIVRGLTVRNAVLTNRFGVATSHYGAGANLKHTDVDNCVFLNCVRITDDEGGGGGLCLADNCKVTDTLVKGCLADCTVSGKYIGGGGIYISANGCVLDGVTVRDCTLIRECSDNNRGGGGIMLADAKSAQIYNSKILYNYATNRTNKTVSMGAGIHYYGSLAMTNCLVEGNYEAAAGGGGMRTHNASSLMIVDCTFRGNGCLGGASALSANGSPVAMTNCLFELNYPARTILGCGGNAYFATSVICRCVFRKNDCRSASGNGTGALMTTGDKSIVTDCLFEDNLAGTANSGGVVQIQGSDNLVDRCLFRRNSATGTSPSYCGVIAMDQSGTGVTIRNCRFEANTNQNVVAFTRFNNDTAATMENGRGAYLFNCTFETNMCVNSVLGGGSQVAAANAFCYNNKFIDNAGNGGKKIFWQNMYETYPDHCHANFAQTDVDAATFPFNGMNGNILSDRLKDCENAGETLGWMTRAKTYGVFDAIVTERTVLNGIDLSLGRLRKRLSGEGPDIGAEEAGTGLILMVW